MRKRHDSQFYSIRDISEILGVDYKVVYYKVTHGELPHVRLSNKLIRIKKTDFASWLESKAVVNV